MSRPARLDESTIATALAGLDWERDGDRLVKVVKRADFRDAMAFVNRIADLAEQANHHPDIAISWNTVTLRLSTHASGGLTARDVDLARQIDLLG